MSSISPTICPYPFAHQHIDPDGAIKYCCNSSPTSHISDDGTTYNIKTHSLDQAWNSDSLRQLRLDLINGKEPTACNGCWQRENADHTQGTSLRLHGAHQQIPIQQIQSRIDYAAANDGAVDQNPFDFQIMSGNLCNLACKMCGPKYSNTWSKFFKNKGFDQFYQISFKRGGGGHANPLDNATYVYGDHDWPITNPLNTVLPKYYQDIRHIFLTGGEPTLIQENIAFLEELVHLGYSKNIELRFSTNLTNINQRLMRVLANFRKIGINMSIDGMDDIAYIQRTPSKWQQILNNTDKLVHWVTEYESETNSAVNLTVNTVVSALNIHHVLDLWHFLAKRYGNKFQFGFTSLTDKLDNYFIGQVPKAVINTILENLDEKFQLIYENSNSWSVRTRLESFKYQLMQNIYADTHEDIHYLLDNIQKIHPDMDIKGIYSIYFPNNV
jgi:sulfatase maturation enzyme AslB (radical SAM superfamily)